MKENVQIQINKLKELVHNTVLAKPADFALNFYSVLTAINGLLSIQGSLIEKRLVLNDLEQNGKQDKVVYAQYTGLVKEYVYLQGYYVGSG